MSVAEAGLHNMVVTIKRLSDIYDIDVFTDAGMYFGKIGDAVLGKYMINGWVVKSTPDSLLSKALKNVRAVIVPHKAVKAVGDVMIISHSMEFASRDQEVAEATDVAGEE